MLSLIVLFGTGLCWASPALGIYTNKDDVSIMVVGSESPAEKYGIKEGDKIIRINNEKISSYKNFANVMDSISGNKMFSMTVLREGQEITLQVSKEEYDFSKHYPISQVVNVPEGKFLFSSLGIFTPNNGSDAWLAGKITNNTDKDWKNVSFKAAVYDDKNHFIYDKIFTINYLNKGNQYEFGNKNYGETLYGIKKAAYPKISFVNGTYPVVYNCSMTKPDIGISMQYSDDAISVQYKIVTDAVVFQLMNKTNNPIKVDWNQLSYIDSTGLAQKIIHTGVKYNNANEYQQATIIPPQARIEDQLVPTKNLWFEEGKYGGWRTNPLFPEGPSADKLIGQEFGLFFPLEVNGQVINYNFRFRIESITK